MKATWGSGSTCEIRGITTSSPTTAMAQIFHHLTWNCTNQTTSVNFAGASFTNLGNFRLQTSAGSNEVRFGSGTSPTVRVEGNMSVADSILVFVNGAGVPSVTVLGNIGISNGATLRPSSSTGIPSPFDLTGDLVNDGTLSMGIMSPTTSVKLNKTAGTLNYSGALAITSNAGGSLVGGTTYDLFDAPAFSGAVSSVTALGAGSNWYTGNLTVDGTVLLNRWPTNAGNVTVNRASGTTAKVLKSRVTAVDPDGHSVTHSPSTTTTNGGSVTIPDATYYYASANTVTDAFTVTNSDAFGGAAVTTVFLPVVTVFGTGTGDVTVGVNTATAILSGISGYNYTVQRATNIDFTSGIVSNFAAQTAPANGQITVVDDFADLFGTPNSGTPATAYYRMKYNP